MMSSVLYRRERTIDTGALLSLYADAGWSAYTDHPDRLAAAVRNSLLVLAAWDGSLLVGLIRVVGDGLTIVYVQDILVRGGYKRRGIGKELMRRAMEAFADVRQKVLLTDDSPETRKFYEAAGFESCDRGELVAFVRMRARG